MATLTTGAAAGGVAHLEPAPVVLGQQGQAAVVGVGAGADAGLADLGPAGRLLGRVVQRAHDHHGRGEPGLEVVLGQLAAGRHRSGVKSTQRALPAHRGLKAEDIATNEFVDESIGVTS
jgi:hypothetical protein